MTSREPLVNSRSL